MAFDIAATWCLPMPATNASGQLLDWSKTLLDQCVNSLTVLVDVVMSLVPVEKVGRQLRCSSTIVMQLTQSKMRRSYYCPGYTRIQKANCCRTQRTYHPIKYAFILQFVMSSTLPYEAILPLPPFRQSFVVLLCFVCCGSWCLFWWVPRSSASTLPRGLLWDYSCRQSGELATGGAFGQLMKARGMK